MPNLGAADQCELPPSFVCLVQLPPGDTGGADVWYGLSRMVREEKHTALHHDEISFLHCFAHAAKTKSQIEILQVFSYPRWLAPRRLE
jgi:hypothetical protein